MTKTKKVNKESKKQKQVKAVIYREEFYPFHYIESFEDRQDPEMHGYVIEMPEDNYEEVMMFQNAFLALQEQMGNFYNVQDEAYEQYKSELKRKGKKKQVKGKTCKCRGHCK